MRRWSRRRLAAAAAALVVLGAGAAYGAFVLVAGGSEPRLQPLLAGGTPTDGSWVAIAAPPTAAGYRVREKLVGVPAPHDAVGRTSAVHGTLELRDGRIEALRLDVDLATLRSDRSERDQVLLDEGPQFRRYSQGRFVLRGVAGRTAVSPDRHDRPRSDDRVPDQVPAGESLTDCRCRFRRWTRSRDSTFPTSAGRTSTATDRACSRR